MKTENMTYRSRDGATDIHAVRWQPDGAVRAVLQIVHGMNEFIERYEPFAQFLTEQGFCVVGNDHLGHGQSVLSRDELGFFGHPKGNECVLADVRTLFNTTRADYPDVPYFMLGHSMGSFLVRQYITMFGEELTGAVIMGTGIYTAGTLRAGKTIARLAGMTRGWHYRSPFLNKMAFGNYNRRFMPARTAFDWLSNDTAVVDAYCRNPLNTTMFTVNGYYQMFRSISWAQNRKYMEKIPKELPLLLVSGQEDPVGQEGEGVRAVCGLLRRAGITDVRMKLYPGDRHEILNETDHETVFNDLLGWMQEQGA